MAGFRASIDGDRLDIDHGLAAEGAADLRRIDAQVADASCRGAARLAHARNGPGSRSRARPGRRRRSGPRSLAARYRPDAPRAVLNDISTTSSAAAKPASTIAELEFEPLGDVGRLRRRLDAARDHVVEQQRRIRLHRLIDVDDVRQHLVVDLDQRRAPRRRSTCWWPPRRRPRGPRRAPSRAP